MADLTVFVTGISAFVEDHTAVLFVDGRAGRVAEGNATKIIPAHYPYIRVHQSDVLTGASDDAEPDFSYDFRSVDLGQVTADPSYVYILDDEEVKLPNANPAIHAVDKQSIKTNPTNGDSTSIRWVAPMDKISPGSEVVDEKCFNGQQPHADPERVAAFLFIPNGTYRTRYVKGTWTFDFVSKTATQNLKQSLAQLAMVRFSTQAAITLTLRKYKTNKQRKIRLKGATDITVGNSPLDEILIPEYCDCANGVPDYHFELFYDLCATRPPVEKLFVPRLISAHDPQEHKEVGIPRCIPGGFA